MFDMKLVEEKLMMNFDKKLVKKKAIEEDANEM